MPSISITDLLGIYNAKDFGAIGNEAGDDGPRINLALATAYANGIKMVLVPAGTYLIGTSVVVPSGVTLAGVGSATVLKLMASAYVDVVTSVSTSGIRLRDFRVDGNRANNALGTRHGVWLYKCADAWIENVEAVSCRADGFALDDCDRVTLDSPHASDNGRHGLSFTYCHACQVKAPACYDNCQVETAGTGDGINIALLSSGVQIIAPASYETSLSGSLQGYGVREAAAQGVGYSYILGGYLLGNNGGTYSLESSDSAKA